MEEEQNNDNKNFLKQSDIFGNSRGQRVKNKAKDVMKIIGQVIGHQLKLTLIIGGISLIVIVLLCSAALHVLQLEDEGLETLTSQFTMGF